MKNNRHDAAESGVRRYYTGRVCKQGHDTYRYVSTGNCAGCVAMRSQRYNRKRMDAERGIVTVEYKIHQDDRVAIDRFVSAVNKARELS